MTSGGRSPDAGHALAVGLAAGLAEALLLRVDALTDRLVDEIRALDAVYVGEQVVRREDLWRSCHDNLTRLLEALAGRPVDDEDRFDAPRETGARRARQGMPLESVLHAYRVGGRVIWEGMLDLAREGRADVAVLLDSVTPVWELVDRFSSEVGDAYRRTEYRMARSVDRHRDALLDALLDGRGGDPALAAEVADVLGLPAAGPLLAVVVRQGAGPADSAAFRAADALGAHVPTAWRAGTETLVGIVAPGRRGPDEVASRLQAAGLCPAGVSPLVGRLAELPDAVALAEIALQTLPPGSTSAVVLDERLPAALVAASPALAARLVAHALGGVLGASDAERGVLLETLRAWLGEDRSPARVAARLYCHRNTVLNRLHRVGVLTGLDLERTGDLVCCALALHALDLGVAAPAGPADTTGVSR